MLVLAGEILRSDMKFGTTCQQEKNIYEETMLGLTKVIYDPPNDDNTF